MKQIFFTGVLSIFFLVFQGCEPGTPMQTGSPPANGGEAALNPQGPSEQVEGGSQGPAVSENGSMGDKSTSPKGSPTLPASEIISQTASVSCFAFSLVMTSAGSIPAVVYEENLGRTRNLIFAKRPERAWEAHNLTSVDDAPVDSTCFFRPAMFSQFGIKCLCT